MFFPVALGKLPDLCSFGIACDLRHVAGTLVKDHESVHPGNFT